MTTDLDELDVIFARYSAEQRSWVRGAISVIHDVCRSQAEVTTYSIWPRLESPPGGDGRALGKAMRFALKQRWLEKDKDPRTSIWRAYDHCDLGPLLSMDGATIKLKTLVPAYRSLLHEREKEMSPDG
jgi:hypothetical protein